MTHRLPNPGADDNQWGDILNDFLSQSHALDGSLKTSALQDAGAVTTVNSRTPTAGTVTLTAGDVGALTQSTADGRYVSGIAAQMFTDGQKAQVQQNVGVANWERGVSIRDYGAVGDGSTDDGPALAAALAALAPLVGTTGEKTLYLTEACYVTNQALSTNAAVKIQSLNRLGTRIKVGPSFPDGGTLLSYVMDGSSPLTLEGKVPGIEIHGVTLDGNQRAKQVNALKLDLFDRGQLDMYITGFRGTALKARCLREMRISGLRAWLCGDPTHPVLDLDETGSTNTEGSNLNHFTACIFALNMGDQLRIKAPSPVVTRVNFFSQCVFHGLNEWIEDYADEWGDYVLGTDGDMSARLVIDNGRTVIFDACRFHLAGRGQPLFWLTNKTAGASTLNSVTISNSVMSWRSNIASSRTILSVDTAADTMQLNLAAVTTNRHQLQTGSRIQLTAPSSGSLPTPLVVATNYYVIKVDDNNFKLATSRANAAAGTAIDLTATGSGTLIQYDWAATVTAAADTLTIPDHRYSTGARVQIGADTTVPSGLTATTDYFVVRVDKDTIKLATTMQHAVADAPTTINITSAGAAVWLVPEDFVAYVESGTLVWASGNTIDGSSASTRGYFRVDDTNTPVGSAIFAVGSNWAAGGTAPMAEFSSGGQPVYKVDGQLDMTRNNHPLVMAFSDGTLVQVAKVSASNAVNVGSLSGTTANATFSGTGLATINGGGSERFRASSVGLSFNGVAAVAKPTITGSKGSNAALASLLTALANMGLLTDSST